MIGWPTKDANLILIFELILLVCIFTMNGTDEVLFNRGVSHASDIQGSFGFSISSIIGPLFFDSMSNSSLFLLERMGWWGHLFMVIGFLNYLPYSNTFTFFWLFQTLIIQTWKRKGSSRTWRVLPTR